MRSLTLIAAAHVWKGEIIAASLSDNSFAIQPAQLFLCNGAQHAIEITLCLVGEAK